MELVLKTDELFGHDGLWFVPRGRDYGVMLPNPKPWQHANLYPDPNSTYWFTMIEMPEDSVLTFRGKFTHSRYMQFSLHHADPKMGSFTATGEALVDHHIEADPGSENPFLPGARRDAENRNYTIRVVNAGPPAEPADREPNTMYAGPASSGRWSTGCTCPTRATSAMQAQTCPGASRRSPTVPSS